MVIKTENINDGSNSNQATVAKKNSYAAVRQVSPEKVTLVRPGPAAQAQQAQVPVQPGATYQQTRNAAVNVAGRPTPGVKQTVNKVANSIGPALSLNTNQAGIAKTAPQGEFLKPKAGRMATPKIVKPVEAGNAESFLKATAYNAAADLASSAASFADTPDVLNKNLAVAEEIRTPNAGKTQETFLPQLQASNVKAKMSGIADNMSKQSAQYEKNLNGVERFVSRSIAQGVGQLPQMIGNMITPGGADAWIGATSFNRSYNAAKEAKLSTKEALTYAAVVATIEVASNHISSAFKFDSKGLLDEWQDVLVANSGATGSTAFLLKCALDILGEQLEEETATVPEYLLDWYMLGEHTTKGEDGKEHFDVKGLGKEVLDTFIYTFGSTLFLNLVTGGYSGAARDKFLSDLEEYRAPEQVLTLAEAARRYNAATPEQKDLVVNAVAQSSGENPADVKQRIDAAADDIEANSEGTLAREGEQLDKALQDTLSETEAVQTPQNTVIGRDEDLMNGQPAQDDALTNALRVQTDPNYLVDEYNGQQIFRSDYDATPKGQNLKQFGKDIGRNIVVVKNLPNFADGMWYNGKILVSENAFKRGFGKPVAVKHELLHSLRGANVFNDLLSYANSQIKARPDSIIEFDENGNRIKYSSYEQYMNALVSRYAKYGAYGLENGATWDSVQQNPDLANIIQEEAAAFWVQNNLFQSDDDVKRLVRSSRSTAERIWQALKDMIRQWTGMDDEYTAAIRRAERMFAKALSETQTEDRAPVALDEKQNPQRDYAGRPITPEQAKIQSEVGPNVAFSIPTFRRPGAKGKYSASVNNNKGGFAGLSEIIAGKDVLRRTMAKKGFSPVQADTVVGFLEHMANHLQDETLQAKYNYIGWQDLEDATVTVRTDIDGNIVSVAVSAMVANGEYPVNFDLTTICNKREGIMQVIQELANIEATDENGVKRSALNSIKLTDENMWHINEALKSEGIDTACLGCFVEARRYYTNNFMNKIDEVWNAAVRDARERLGLPTDGEDAYFNFAKGKKPTKEDYMQISELWTAYDESTESKRSPSQRIKVLMDEIVRNGEVDSPYLKYVQASDVLTPEGIRGFKELSTHRSDRDMVKLLKSIYGTSAPKEILAFTPYNSEIALLPDKMKNMETGEYLKSIGGTRVQSFSDFKMEHFFDHMQMVADEAARGFPNHGYSKVIAYPRLFGLTGRKINMSVMFDVLPAEAWQKQFNCSAERAEELASTYQGLQFVTEVPENNVDNRPYKPVTIEGVDGYLTYLLSDADAINAEYDRLYRANLAKGMDSEEARRQANRDKPFEQSINYREAVELENREGYKNNVGIVAVSYGDEHFRMLLDDPNVRYIIPYHRSGLPVFVASKTSLDVARDYTMRQNTAKIKGGLWKRADGSKVYLKAEYRKFLADHPDAEFPAIDFFKYVNEQGIVPIEDKVEYDENGNPIEKKSKKNNKLHGTGYDVYQNLDKALDIREISNEYLEWCLDKNYAPVFFDFAGHPNYYKVLFDFAVTDADGVIHPQGPVRNIYPGLNLEELSDEIAESGMSAEEFLAANEDRFGEFYAEIERALAEQNAKNERRAKGMPNVLSEILNQDSENSIIAGSNIQSIQYGTPDYTSVKYGAGQSSLLPAAMFSLPSERYNTRALQDFDNTRYGSVIYDLKGRDLERKNANQPMFALADFRQPSYEELIKKKSVEPVDLTNINVKGWDFNSSAEKNYERLGLLDKPILNDDTNEAIFITKNAINHIIHDDDAVSIQGVLLHLPELIRIAKLVDVAPERNPRSGATGAYTFISAGNNQYGTIPVELKVIEYPTGKQNPPANIKDFLINNRLDHYSSLYDGKGLYIEKIDLGKNLGGGTLTNGGLPIIPKSIISVEELLSLVNKDKQNLIPLPEEKMLHVPLEQRLFGDDLLNAYDLISELKDNGAAVDENGYVTVYHRTNSDNANSIIRTQKMIGKEDNIFFSTNPQGSNNQGYGNAIIRLTVPVEDLVLDDIFGDEASVSIPIKDKKNLRLNVQKYKPTIYNVEQPMFSLSSTDPTAKRLKKTYGSKMSAEEISNRLNELFHSFDTMDFSEAEREELAGYIARDIADMIPTRKAISTESQHVLNTLKDITIRLTDSQKSEARHAFGDLREFQKAIAPVKMRNDGEMLTDAWLDWSQDSGSNGMIDTSIPEDSIPSALAELVGKLKDTHEELDYDVLEEITSDILEAYNNQEADVSDLKDPGEIDEFKDMYGDGEGIRSIDSTGIAQKINGNKRMNGFDSLFRTLDRAAGGDKEVRTWFDKMIERPMYEAHRRYNEGRIKAYDELQDIVDKYGIKAGTKESAAIQWYGEGYRVNEDGSRERYGLNKLKQEFPDSWEKIQEAEGWFRNKYDEYVDRINSVLEQIYPDVEEKQQQMIASIQYNIDQLKNQADDIEAHLNRGEYSSVYSNDTLQYVIDQIAREEKALAEATKAYESGEYARNKRLVPRKDYFHHFQDVSEKGIGDLKNLFRGQEVLIDTNLVGISDTTKPKSRWMGFLQHQGKGEFTADAVGGMARYMPSAEYAIAFDPAIAHMRSVVTSLRDSTKKTRNANGLISYLSNFTNDLAGKTAGIDRAVTNFLGEVDGRATLDAIRKLNSRFKANAVGANVRSALAQFSNLPNGIAIVKSNSAWLKGIRDYADSIVKGGSDILDQSVFMTERYFDGDVSQFEKPTLGKKISDASNWMLEFGDKQAARLIWFSAYEEAMEKGLDDPVYYADRCTQQAVAGRGVGEVPYNMSSKMVNLFAPFQVEVNNTWQQLKKMTNERDARGMMRFMLSSWVFEGMMESLLGIDVIPDIFGTVVDTALKLIGGGDDDDDEEESVRAILTQGVREAIGQVVSAIPGASLIAQNIFGIDSDTGEKLFGEGNPSRYGVGLGGLAKLGQTAGDVVEAIANDDKSLGDVDLFGPLVETLMPFGGRQLTRSYKTAQDYGVVPSNTWGNFPFAGGERNTLPGSYTSKGALRFELPTDDPWEMAKAFLLGEYATDAGREYLENGRKTVLTQKQVEAMNEYAASGGDPHDYMQFIKGANTDGNSSISQAEAQEYLDGTNLDDDQKSLIWSLYGTNWKKNPYAETPSEETPSGEQAETSTTEDSTPKLTEAKQTKLDEYVAAGHDQQGMLDFYSGADADGNGRIKQEEAIEWFETSDLDDVQKALIWNLMWPKSAAKNPYD